MGFNLTAAEAAAGAAPEQQGEHSVCFYDNDSQLLDEIASFLEEALHAGGRAVAIATGAHLTELHRRLEGLAAGAGELVLLDAQETLDSVMVDGRPDTQRFEAALLPHLAKRPGKPLHAFGEMVAVLCEQGEYEAALALENLWNGLIRRIGFSLFCGYPWRLFSAGEQTRPFQHVCAAHNRVRGEGTALRQHQQTLALEAEVRRRREAERVLRQRERELADFLDNASEGIHKVAADGTILYANRAELNMLGYRWGDYVGHHLARFYVDPRQCQRILERLKRGEVLRDEPALLRCSNGTHLPVVISSSGHFENGEMRYTRCFTRDATERVALERSAQEKEALLASLREASRAKDEFLAMLGHELRNPLSPIVTALQLMLLRNQSGTSREQAIIQRQVDHLVRLVDDLLDISRITRGTLELKREKHCPLKSVLAKAVEQASILLEQRKHRLEIEVEPGLACEGDPVRLAQVVANLLTNAARYTPPGGDIRLRAWRMDPQQLAISVRDNGVGIAPDTLPKLFELFVQGERGPDRAEGGLGIGLAIVRSLVELHGGSVQARSEGLGQGCEFLVYLPAQATQDEAGASAVKAPAGLRAAQARRVLLVDDNADAAETLGELLEAAGHEVHVVTDPVSVLRALPRLQPEFAVLDIGLPVMDGYELAARLRQAFGDSCTLIALTGYGQENDRARSREAGFDRHWVKPVEPDRLIRLLDSGA